MQKHHGTEYARADGFGPTIPEKLYGIIGHPLAQTLSPLLHNWGFAHLGIKAAYMAFPTPPSGLADFVRAVRTLPVQGLSVTIPHKEPVMALLDGVTDLARRVGAVNTLFWRESGLWGHNTDVEGFTAPLRALLPQARTPVDSALVLGAGGAAKAVLAGLCGLGVTEVTVVNRNRARADTLAQTFGAASAPWEERGRIAATLVVNTTPVGMKGKAEGHSPMPASFWHRGHIAYDLVYNPRETVFLSQARQAGATCADGLAMFAAQGAAQFALWTGLELPLAPALRLLEDALRPPLRA